MEHHKTPLSICAKIIILVVFQLSVNGITIDLTGLDSVDAIQKIPVPENPDAAYYLKIHNAYRALVEKGKLPGLPKPNFMPEMEWDVELEDAAKAHAERCENDYEDAWGLVEGFSTDKSKEPLHDAFNQINLFLKEPRPYYEKYQQFAQMVTANARRLGCARRYCEAQKEYITVCKYWARYKFRFEMPFTGNFTTPYTETHCGACPLQLFADLKNDTRYREKSKYWIDRPGTPMPPSVMDSSYYLDIHNGYRDVLREAKLPIRAKPFYMAKMEWDPILENAARRHAEGCDIVDHFPLDDTHTIFQGFDDKEPNKQLVHRWFDMFLSGFYVYNHFFGDQADALVAGWGITRSIGCWQTKCSPYEGHYSNYHRRPVFFLDATILVCKYHPQFNMARFYPYIEKFNYTRNVFPDDD